MLQTSTQTDLFVASSGPILIRSGQISYEAITRAMILYVAATGAGGASAPNPYVEFTGEVLEAGVPRGRYALLVTTHALAVAMDAAHGAEILSIPDTSVGFRREGTHATTYVEGKLVMWLGVGSAHFERKTQGQGERL